MCFLTGPLFGVWIAKHFYKNSSHFTAIIKPFIAAYQRFEIFTSLFHFHALSTASELLIGFVFLSLQYAQWAPENCRSYILVKCQYIGQMQHEMHVELLRNELCSSTSEIYIEKMMQDAIAYQDQFEVYIQTLISQALDSNFLSEIMQEQGENVLIHSSIIINVNVIYDLRLF